MKTWQKNQNNNLVSSLLLLIAAIFMLLMVFTQGCKKKPVEDVIATYKTPFEGRSGVPIYSDTEIVTESEVDKMTATAGSDDRLKWTSNEFTAINISHYESDVQWEISSIKDLLECTDNELHNIGTFVALFRGISLEKNYYLLLGNRLIPERFKKGKKNE